jgi:hypothetical protein
MNIAWRASAVGTIVTVFALVGCDSTQPDRIETRTASVVFETKASTQLFNCYDQYEDIDGDGIPEQFDGVVCFPTVEYQPRDVPWRYSIKITAIRAGSVDEQVVTSTTGAIGSSVESGDLLDDFVSLTGYDTGTDPAPGRPNEGNIYYLNGHKVSTGSPIYLASVGVDAGIPNILDATPTFDFNLNSGDTVIVRVRKQSLLDSPHFLPADPDPRIQIMGFLLVGGDIVAPQSTPPLGGGSTSPTSTIDDKSGVTFSYTVR